MPLTFIIDLLFGISDRPWSRNYEREKNVHNVSEKKYVKLVHNPRGLPKLSLKSYHDNDNCIGSTVSGRIATYHNNNNRISTTVPYLAGCLKIVIILLRWLSVRNLRSRYLEIFTFLRIGTSFNCTKQVGPYQELKYQIYLLIYFLV